MEKMNSSKCFHGSEKIQNGKLTGSTDTDYFYFFCPQCGDTQILRILDFQVIYETPTKKIRDERPKIKRDFTIGFELYCKKCKLRDFVKISNRGWQEGKLKNSVSYK